MRKINGFWASAALGGIFLGAMVTGSAAAAREPQIAGYCWVSELTASGTIHYNSSTFQKDSLYFDRDDWIADFQSLLRERGVNPNTYACRVWKGTAGAVEAANEEKTRVPVRTQYMRVVDIDWVPEDTWGGSKPRPAGRPASARSDSGSPTPSVERVTGADKPAAPKYVEVAGPNGTQRLSPEVAARNQAAADEYRRKMEEHAAAKAEHDRKLALHQQSQAKAAAEQQAYQREVAAAAERTAAHRVAMADHARIVAGASTNNDPNRCITSPAIKPGLRGNTEAQVTNGCDQKVDIVICLKRTTGDWLCGAQFGILSQRTMTFMSTNATGEIYVDAVTFGSGNKLGRPAGIIK